MFIYILHYLFLTIFFAFFICYVYFKYSFQYWRKRDVVFLKPSFPFGNIKKCVDGRTHISDIIKDVHNQINTPYAGAYFLSKPVLFIKDPAILKHILIKDFNNFPDRGVHCDGDADPLSLHLFRLPGEKWRNLRTKLTPMFTSSRLKTMFPTTIKSAQQMQDALRKIAISGNSVDVRNNNEFLTFDDLVAQVYVFIAAGYDTSATTMTNCLFELAKKPEVQLKIQKNIDEVLQKHNGQFTYESLNEMECLANAVSETLRMYPPLGFLNRIAKEKYKLPNSDLIIDKNMSIVISIAGIQNDPENFENPDNFDPDRFSAENRDKIQPFTYLPYGEGPRFCVGKRLAKLKMMIGLAMALSKYNFEVCSDTPKKLSHICGQIILTAVERVKLRITERK